MPGSVEAGQWCVVSEFGWIFLLGVFAVYALFSERLRRSPVTGPMVIVAAGILVSRAVFSEVSATLDSHAIGVILELALALVLFTDAVAVDSRALRQESFIPTRLLGFAMPLSILFGLGAAFLLFGPLSPWEAAAVAVVLAPTDAALAQSVVTDQRLPRLIRQGLSVESGLNDGLAVPILAIVIVQAQVVAGIAGQEELGRVFLEEIGIGLLVGVAVGWFAGKSVLYSSRQGWIGPIWRGVLVTAIAVLTFIAADALGGSGFIAAFAGGIVFGRLVRHHHEDIGEHAEGIAHIMTMLAMFVFGALLLGPRLDEVTASMLLHAALSLTILRLVPVSVSMLGAKLNFRTTVFLGWFGPRGLASLVFAVTIIHESGLPQADLMITVITTTVGMSVLLHGVTAWWGASRYSEWFNQKVDQGEQMTESAHIDFMGERTSIDSGFKRPNQNDKGA